MSTNQTITINLPKEISSHSFNQNILSLTGPQGTVTKYFSHPSISIVLTNENIILNSNTFKKKEKAILGTYESHIKNIIKGVIFGFSYHMKILYSHFPIKVSLSSNKIKIENYVGEKLPRYANIVGKETKITINNEDIIITSPNIEDCGQTSSNISKASSRGKFDKRVFQDGIYITKKESTVTPNK